MKINILKTYSVNFTKICEKKNRIGFENYLLKIHNHLRIMNVQQIIFKPDSIFLHSFSEI